MCWSGAALLSDAQVLSATDIRGAIGTFKALERPPERTMEPLGNETFSAGP